MFRGAGGGVDADRKRATGHIFDKLGGFAIAPRKSAGLFFSSDGGIVVGGGDGIGGGGSPKLCRRIEKRPAKGPVHAGGLRANSRHDGGGPRPRTGRSARNLRGGGCRDGQFELSRADRYFRRDGKDRRRLRAGQGQGRQTRCATAGGGRLSFAPHGGCATESQSHA